jgi:multiple sugar transport system permease protein
MLYIILPVAVPGILSAGIFAFTLSWNEFIYALVFLSSPQQKTVAVGRRRPSSSAATCSSGGR